LAAYRDELQAIGKQTETAEHAAHRYGAKFREEFSEVFRIF